MATVAGVPETRRRRLLQKYLPIVGWLPRYEREWLVADAVAGLSVWALLVPQSLAYATIVGVTVQYGLYTAFAALLVYPLFGTSKRLVVGPSATVGAVSAAVVAPLVGTAALGTDEAATYAAALALATALVYIALGLLRAWAGSRHVTEAIGPQHFYPSVQAAVEAFVRSQKAPA